MIDSPIGDLKEVDPKDVQEGQKLVILRAVEGMVFLFYSGDGWGEISGDHYFLVGDKPEIPDAATVEQSQVEALGSLIWHTSRDDESTISATGATIIAKAILAKFNVTEPDASITDLIAEARGTVARIHPGHHDPDALFQYRGGVFGREVTLMLRELADALESVTVPTENELLERAKADATNDAFVDAVAWARSCSGESADAAADYIQEMSTRGSEN